MNKKVLSILMALLIFTLSLTACSSSEPAGTSAPTGASGFSGVSDGMKTVTIAESNNFVGGFASIYGPDQGSSFSYYLYVGNFYEPLVRYENGEIVAGLAKEWFLSEDGLVYTFSLEEGILFSDGTELTSQVVKLNLLNFNTILGAAAANYGTLNSLIEDIVILSDYKFEIHLAQPYYATLVNLAMVMPRGIMAAAAFNEDGTMSEALKTATYGTGPYMYAGENNNDLSYNFVRNPHYNRPLPELDGFTVKVIEENEPKALALRSGEVDIIVGADNISYDTYDNLAGSKGYAGTVAAEHSLTEFLALNPEAAPFDDLRVRQAVHHALDKEGIVKNLFGGHRTVADTIMDASLPYCNISVTPYDYNVEKAKALLAEAGWRDQDGNGVLEKNGAALEAELKYVSNTINDKTALAIQAALKTVGMDVKLTGMELMAFFSDIYSGGAFSMAYYESYGVLYDPFTYVANMNPNMDYTKPAFSTDPMVAKALPSMGYDAAYDFIGSIPALVGEENIAAAFHTALETAHKDSVLIPVNYVNELVLYNSNVIAGYSFAGVPTQVNVAGITLKLR
ncbi:MAG: ABC transporter substrate-binding protein [Clostridiales bacterium]